MWAWLENLITTDIAQYELLGIFITMALESACIPIPSEVVMPFAGHLVAKGSLGMAEAALTASAANLVGSWIAYFVGRFGGRKFIHRYGRYIMLSQRHLVWAERWFEKKGEVTVFISRMLPGVRTFISLPAGVAKMNFPRFSLYSFLGSVPWNFALVYLGFVFSDNWELLQNYLHEFNFVVFGLIFIILLLFFARRWFRKH